MAENYRDNEIRGGRRAGEGEAAQAARAKRKSVDAFKEAADAFRVDPEMSYRENWRRIVGKQIDRAVAADESSRAKEETGYAKGGMVKGKRGCGKATKGFGKGKMY